MPMCDKDKKEIKAMIAEQSRLDKSEITNLIKVATEEAISETFRAMGIDVNDFDHVNQFRENQAWVVKYRKAAEAVGSRIIVTLTTAATGGVIAAVWAYMSSRGLSK